MAQQCLYICADKNISVKKELTEYDKYMTNFQHTGICEGCLKHLYSVGFKNNTPRESLPYHVMTSFCMVIFVLWTSYSYIKIVRYL